MTKKFFIVISGPTGVGKTDLVEKLIEKSNLTFEVVNADLGQFYKPLSIGTAKPDLEHQNVKHHLFDILDSPINFTVFEYRKVLINCLNDLWSRKIIPIIVGGSSFYIKSIFFPTYKFSNKKTFLDLSKFTLKEIYNQLKLIDSERARHIDPNDRYRIERALQIWYQTGQLPSKFKPLFNPIGRCLIYFLTREREDLYNRINQRVIQMIEHGWIDEVKKLDKNWWNFLLNKKLIGYPEIIEYIQKEGNKTDLIEKISQKTRAYAKRQLTFWSSLCKLLLSADREKKFIVNIQEINLTFLKLDLYIEELLKEIKVVLNCM